jgi:hypothetical protein
MKETLLLVRNGPLKPVLKDCERRPDLHRDDGEDEGSNRRGDCVYGGANEVRRKGCLKPLRSPIRQLDTFLAVQARGFTQRSESV